MHANIPPKVKPGYVVLFGSGEMSPTGRKIHEEVFKRSKFMAPVKIGILETPTGFEINAIHGWPERMQKFFETGLSNFKPKITRIRAWKSDGPYSTNDPAIVDAIRHQDYIYCGAGSPGYTVRNLNDSLAFKNMLSFHENGGVLCFGSATAIAVSSWAIPVYEIFKTGAPVDWIPGLHFFDKYGLNLAIVPHWNNREGADFDTTRSYMGKVRFNKLQKLLPESIAILGIEEQTACLFDFQKKTIDVSGNGSAHIFGQKKRWKEVKSGASFSFTDLT